MRKEQEENMRRQEESDEEEYDEMKREHEMMMGERREENMRELQEEYRAKLQEDEEYMRKLQEEEYMRNPKKYDDMDDDELEEEINKVPFWRQRGLRHLQVKRERKRQEDENKNNNPASNQVKKHPWGSTWFPTEEERREDRRRQEEEDRRFANATLWNGQLLRHDVHNNQLEWDNDEWTTDDDDDVDDARRQRVVRYNPPYSDPSSLQPSPSQQLRQPSPAQQMRQPSPAQQMRQHDSWREPLPSVNTSMARRDVHNTQMEAGGRGSEEEDADVWDVYDARGLEWDNDEWTTDDDDDVDDARRQRVVRYNPTLSMDDDVWYGIDGYMDQFQDYEEETENYAAMCGIDVDKVDE